MMSLLSCAYWPSVRLLWRNVYLGLLPIFFIGLFVFLVMSCMSCLYILESKTLLVISDTKKETLERDCKQTIPFKSHQKIFRSKPDKGGKIFIC